MAKLDLRRTPPASPATLPTSANQHSVAQQLFPSGMPLAAGTVVDMSKMTPMERETLQGLGVASGDAIPANMAEILTMAAANKADKGDVPIDPATPPLQVTVTQMSDLSPDKQQELANALKNFSAQKKFFDSRPVIPGAAPGVNEALAVTHVATAAPPPAAAPTAPAPTPAADDSVAPLKFCRHCFHDLADANIPQPTLDDKRLFMAATLSQGKLRFVKTYAFLGGQLELTFRTLSTVEANRVFTQLGYDVRADRIMGEGEYAMAKANYRLSLSVSAVQIRGAGRTEVPTMLDIETDKLAANMTEIPAITDYVQSTLLPSEPLRRQAGLAFMEFGRLVEHMEANMYNADFWQGID